MSNIINSYLVFETNNEITAVADTIEVFNRRTGDIDLKESIRFYNKNLEDIGFANIGHYGDHVVLNGDYHGRRLAKSFGYAPKSCW